MKVKMSDEYKEFQQLVWNKYRHSDDETPEDIFRRVAEVYYPEMEEIFFDNDGSASYRLIPGGRVLFAAGKEGASPYNCSVLPSPKDSMEGIFETAKIMAMSFKAGLGVGIDLSTLRPEGSTVKKGSAGSSTGAWSWAELYSTVTGLVGQNSRRGALLLSLSVSHPDILKFIKMKHNLSQENQSFLSQLGINEDDPKYDDFKYLLSRHQVRYANISVKITDDFMKAVENDNDWNLHFSIIHDDNSTTEINETTKARLIWDKIIENMYESSEPGFLFMDNIEKNYILNDYKPIVTTNPCIAEGDMVATDIGYKKIEDITTDDKVLAGDGKYYPITWAGFTGEREVFEIELSDGRKLHLTNEHKVYLEDGTLKRVDELHTDDKLYDMKNDRYYIPEKDSIYIISVTPTGLKKTYDLHQPFSHQIVVNGILTSNCGEVYLSEWGMCNLSSVNLVAHLDENREIDWDKLEETVRYAVRFGNELIDRALYPFPEFEKESKHLRKYGLGIMGLADVFLLKHIRYGSDESVKIAEDIMKFIAIKAFDESANLAKEFGPAPAIVSMFGKKYYNSHKNDCNEQIIENSEFLQRLCKEAPKVCQKIKKYGLRNVNLLSIAPTGSISLISGVSSAFEPVFYLKMQRWSDSFKKLVEFTHPVYSMLIESGDIKEDEEYDWLVTSDDIDPFDKLKIHKALQNWVDLSISNTYSVSDHYSKNDISNLVIKAWKEGLKGITIYRQGTRGSIIRSSDRKSKKEEVTNFESISSLSYDRPSSLTARSYKYNHNGDNHYIIVAGERNNPLEIYLGSKNMKEQSYIIALNSVISSILKISYAISTKYNIDLYKTMLDKIINELLEIKDGENGAYYFMGKKYYSPVNLWGFSLNYFRKQLTPDKEKERRIEEALQSVEKMQSVINNDKEKKANVYDFYPGGIDKDDLPDDAIMTKCPFCGSIIWTKGHEFEFDCNNPCPNCGYSEKCE